jgi:hypothetical protein
VHARGHVVEQARARGLDLGAANRAVLVDADGLVEVAIGDLQRDANGAGVDGEVDVGEARLVRARRRR